MLLLIFSLPSSQVPGMSTDAPRAGEENRETWRDRKKETHTERQHREQQLDVERQRGTGRGRVSGDD